MASGNNTPMSNHFTNGRGGIVISTKSISLILSIIGLITVMYTTISTINQYTFKIEQLEIQNANLVTQISRLNGKITDLDTQLDELKIIITRLEERSKNNNNNSTPVPTGSSNIISPPFFDSSMSRIEVGNRE